jgi:hypothetical protein
MLGVSRRATERRPFPLSAGTLSVPVPRAAGMEPRYQPLFRRMSSIPSDVTAAAT